MVSIIYHWLTVPNAIAAKFSNWLHWLIVLCKNKKKLSHKKGVRKLWDVIWQRQMSGQPLVGKVYLTVVAAVFSSLGSIVCNVPMSTEATEAHFFPRNGSSGGSNTLVRFQKVWNEVMFFKSSIDISATRWRFSIKKLACVPSVHEASECGNIVHETSIVLLHTLIN